MIWRVFLVVSSVTRSGIYLFHSEWCLMGVVNNLGDTALEVFDQAPSTLSWHKDRKKLTRIKATIIHVYRCERGR